tara:strand:- start:283 stop:702 length:420 start_codon:yes stop_codon:yes gene_type:complete
MQVENQIRLSASNIKDLKVFSYLCQDAILSKDEFFFDEGKQIFIASLSRYCWEKEGKNNNSSSYRVISGLQIKSVESIYYNSLNSDISFLNLLAISYKNKKITLHFSMSIEIILNCKKIDALLEDIDLPWPTKLKPKHQ